MFVRDHCDECDGPADVGLVDEPVRLSIRIWQCTRCGHLTVTAYDWQLREIVDAEVFNARTRAKTEKKNRRAER